MAAKENPADAAAGLSNESDQTGLWFTGEEFSAAFRLMLQAHDIIAELVGMWDSFEKGRSEDAIEDWEWPLIIDAVQNAEVIYRECYRKSFVDAFETLFGVTYETFEVSLLEMKRVCGAA